MDTSKRLLIDLSPEEASLILKLIGQDFINKKEPADDLISLGLMSRFNKVLGRDTFVNKGYVWVDEEFEEGRRRYRGP